jgi:hypothetical protein
MLFTFRYSEWALATSLEIIASQLNQGKNLSWIDWTGRLQENFEFPIADRFHNFETGWRIRRSGLLKSILDLFPLGQFEWSGQISSFSECNVEELADEVAYLELISLLRESTPKVEDHTKLFNNLKKTFQLTYDAAYATLAEVTPSRVYIYNGRFLQERAVWEVCKALSIPVTFFERFNPNWINRYFLFEKPTHSPSYRSSIMQEFGMNLHESNRTSFYEISTKWFEDRILGITQNFTKNQKSELTPTRPYLVFFHSSEDELITTDLSSVNWKSQIEALNSLIEVMNKIGAYDLVIRMHPNLMYKSKREIRIWEEFGKHVAKNNTWIHYISPKHPANSYKLIENSLGVITVGSTIGVEAAYLDKKSILIGRAFHEDMGITQNPRGQVDLAESILNELTNEELASTKTSALRYASFHSDGGTTFKWVAQTKSTKRTSYWFGTFKITRSFSVSALMRLDILAKRIRNAVHSLVSRSGANR